MDVIKEIHSLGQSLWYDNIERKLIDNGELAEIIDMGVIRGVTSNPTIFHNAIEHSTDYDSALKPMAWSGWSPEKIFYQLAIEDIRAAADLFLPLYEQTNGEDGFVSLEVSPYLAHDIEGTIEEAKCLWNRVNRPNLMVKIPATKEGITAIKRVISIGINVNVTLIFSIERYEKVMDAYLSGIEERIKEGKPVNHIASVASFFVSRLDTKIDSRLEKIINTQNKNSQLAKSLLGKAAIANTRLAYDMFKKMFNSERFAILHKQGAAIQRPLWASTSTKNPNYKDVLYIDELIAPHTVNTVPPKTLSAFRDHGKAVLSLEGYVEESHKTFSDLESIGISILEITKELEEEGVNSFSDSFTALLKTIKERCSIAQQELGGAISTSQQNDKPYVSLQNMVSKCVIECETQKTIKRLFELDASLWTDDTNQQKEIRQRLGWLSAPQNSQSLLSDMLHLAAQSVLDGYTHALVLGMGGSSLAPEVMRMTFGVGNILDRPALDLAILDSTDPLQIQSAAKRAPLEKTLFIVSSKSGTTSEVHAFFNYFWHLASTQLGQRAGDHFIAITDPDTPLEKLANERSFRKVILADPNVGGRYSALIEFGLVPAALMGLDIVQLLLRAQRMADQCSPQMPYGRNPGLVLGAILAEAYKQKRDKLTLIADPEIESFGYWLEQLVAESSGKNGKGIIPITHEELMKPDSYSNDRLFIYLRSSAKKESDIQKIRNAGHPVIEFALANLYDLGAEYYRWEIAVAVACSILGINAFDQPDVQENKTRTAEKVKAFQQNGLLPNEKPIWQGAGGTVYGRAFPGLEKSQSLAEVLDSFLNQTKAGDYIAINAYMARNKENTQHLQKIRTYIQRRTGNATTLGFGPRFLHSTGQLHKGGANNGLFIQITQEIKNDVSIPGQGITFGFLERAQAQGDIEVLIDRDRRVINLHLIDGQLNDLIP